MKTKSREILPAWGSQGKASPQESHYLSWELRNNSQREESLRYKDPNKVGE